MFSIGCRFKRLEKASALIYIYSYCKICLDLCKFPEKPPSHKMRQECVLVKEYDVTGKVFPLHARLRPREWIEV